MAASIPASPTQPIQYAAGATQLRNGLGVAALVCGIIGVLAGLIPLLVFVSFPLGILAVVFGVVGIRRVKKSQADNRGMAITGLVTGIIAVALAVWGFVIVTSSVNQLNNDLNKLQSDNNASSLRGDQQGVDHQGHVLISQTDTNPSTFQRDQEIINHQEHLVIVQSAFIGNFNKD